MSEGLTALIGNEPLLNQAGEKVELGAVVGSAPLVGIYFSAHWCGPCRNFTPQLVQFKAKLKEAGTELPIIFGSSDKDDASMKSYFGEMTNFHAFPHGDPRIEPLKKKYKVSGIPWLVILDSNGNLVLNEADNDVPKGPAAYADWVAQAK
mmetsp:Transcript_27180/g.55414  ORF Transcript_27180/g.55414 Transcript_27180/m.55414 type:complete len:150 (+) Transcript_27180:45-494(+)|eukprot:CAMPEP_0181315538 /NCGR_PEP_ID=MMETSP1101-20121128/15432_1 /TAXON_ID=46948 /ORGANISM="Rhodomonas abbreviata, Strain Caron Lab Isolate" /LENGTH=149 /DNA_ID=CAMNT_0023422759 /DNA_START=41 /DNA_END=490 /DNA_ORIENTATION=-